MSRNNRGVPGNTIQEGLELSRDLTEIGRIMRRLDRLFGRAAANDVYLNSLKFKVNNDDGTDVLLVVSATTQEGFVVSFVGGSSVYDCIRSFVRMMDADSLKWRKDEYRSR